MHSLSYACQVSRVVAKAAIALLDHEGYLEALCPDDLQHSPIRFVVCKENLKQRLIGHGREYMADAAASEGTAS